MPIGKTLEKRIQYRIKRQKESAFLLSDFQDLSDKDQIMRALKKLIAKKLIIKVGQGVYARAKISNLTGEVIPEKTLREIGLETLKKLNVKIIENDYASEYNSQKTTQVPTGRLIKVLGRITRKIGFNGNYIVYGRAH